MQILRLCKVGKIFFETGEYMVKVKDFDPVYHDFLMDIKTNPQDYTCDQLSKIVDIEFNRLSESMDVSTISYKFNVELAADFVESARFTYDKVF